MPQESSTCPCPTPSALTLEATDPTSDRRWDTWVERYAESHVFHTSAWARVLKETYRFSPRYLRLEASGGPQLLLPLVEVDSWLTGRRGISLPFSDECLPLGDLSLVKLAFRALQKEGMGRRWRYVELRGGTDELPGASPSATYYTHHLDLARPLAETFARFDPAVRRAIRKAQKSNLTVDFASNQAAMLDYFRLHELTRRRHGLPPQPFAFFEAIGKHVLATGHGFLALIRSGDRPIAGTIFFHLGRNALFKFGASDRNHQSLRPMNLALWSAIQRVHELGCTQVHFGRNALFPESLRRFKLSWGTTEGTVHYTQFDLAAGRFLTGASLLHGWQNMIFRRLPLPVSRLAGRLLYRHIA